jgi:glycosyltransferase involved in cell wall biosynthesis
LIVVDDGSTDDTVAVLEALHEPKLRILRLPRIGNVARLRNVGASSARGDYLAFLDSDDLWALGKLEAQLQALARSPRAWSYAEHGLVDADGVKGPLRAGQFHPACGRIARDLLTDRTGAAVITWLVPRSLFEQVGGFDESLSLREDLDLALRLAERADAVAVPQVLAWTREHETRKTRGTADQHLKTAVVFQKAAKRLTDPGLHRIARRRAAGHLRSAGKQLLGKGEFRRGLRALTHALMESATSALLRKPSNC